MFEELSFDGICDYKKVEDVLKNADSSKWRCFGVMGCC